LHIASGCSSRDRKDDPTGPIGSSTPARHSLQSPWDRPDCLRRICTVRSQRILWALAIVHRAPAALPIGWSSAQAPRARLPGQRSRHDRCLFRPACVPQISAAVGTTARSSRAER
jgi:hypothetical protein